MTENQIILNSSVLVYISLSIGIGGAFFTVFNYFRNPQIKSEKTDAILGEKIGNLSRDITNLKDNHIHSLELRVEQATTNIAELSKTVVKLATIIDERMPKKNQ